MKIGEREEEIIKILAVIFLITFSIFLASVYKIQLKGYTFYEQFFYLPIVLSSFWWGKKGMVTAIVMIVFVIILGFYSAQPKEVFSSIIKSILILITASLISLLSEEKSKALEKEREFKLKTAHYFFNPIAIGEGFIEIAMEKANDEIKNELKTALNALERIKKVVKNVVEKGEIKE